MDSVRGASVKGVASGDSESRRQSSGGTSVESQVDYPMRSRLLGPQALLAEILTGLWEQSKED